MDISFINLFPYKVKCSLYKLKSKYFYNNKEIDENDLLINLIQPLSKSKRITSANLSIEVEETNNISDKSKAIYSQLLQPKLHPFGIYKFNPKKSIISYEQYPKNMEVQYELYKFNENSAYCNSPKGLFISGGIYNQKEIKNFWIINNEPFNIKNFNLIYPKSNHSMIYIEYRNNKFIYFAGGQDLKSFYYDINEGIFTNWGNMNFYHYRPALIQIENYLYCFDTSFKNEITFERTNLDDDRHKWEKIIPNYENGKISNFTNSGFGVTMVGGGRILFCGGDNVNLYTYLYDIRKNIIYINDKSEDILFTLSDKNFYKINKNYSVALPSSLDELKEVIVVDKSKNILKSINCNGNEDSKKNKFNYNNIDIDNSSQNTLIGNVDIVFKEENINDANDNMIDNKSQSDFIYDNNIYIEKKYESNSISEEISEKFRNTMSNLTGNYDYIYNNDNFTNYKRERKNVYNLISNSFNENDESNNNVKRSRYKNNKKSHKNYKISSSVVDDDEFLDAEGNNFIYDSNKNKYRNSKEINNFSINNNNRANAEYKQNIMKYGNKAKNIIDENEKNMYNSDNNDNIKVQEKKEEIEHENNMVINNNINNYNYNEEQIIGNEEGYNQDHGYKEISNEIQNEYIKEDNNGKSNKNDEQNYEEEHEHLNDNIQNNEANNEQKNEENIIIQNEQYTEENKEVKENNNDEGTQIKVQEASEEEIELNKLKDQNNNEEEYEEQNDNNEEQYEEQNNNEEQYEEQSENNEEQYEDQDENKEEPNDEKYAKHAPQNNNQNENPEEEECEEENENNEEQYEEHSQNDGKENIENSEDEAFQESNEENHEKNNEEGDFEEVDENNHEKNVEENKEKANGDYNIEGEEEEYKNGMEEEEEEQEQDQDQEEEEEQEQEQGQNSDENIEDDNLNDKDNYEHQERDKFEQTIIQSLGEDIIQIDSHPNLYYYDENTFCDYLHEVEEMKSVANN